jgi:hypothetical protein
MESYVGNREALYALAHNFSTEAEVDPEVLAAAHAVQESKVAEYTRLLRLQVTKGIDAEAASMALSGVSVELEQARRRVADLETRHIGVKLGEEWWREVVVEKTVQKVRVALDAGDLPTRSTCCRFAST